MKTTKNLVKIMLMSIAATATVMFTACSDELNEIGNGNNQMPEGAQTALLEAYGLTYENFINADDVIILDADTTQLSVSKAYAEKMGITTFVGHPMGIWHKIEQLPYIRKATAEKLVGDRYILTVQPATIAEIIGDKKVQLNTGVYVNHDAEGGDVTRADGSVLPSYAAKYMDENEVLHPAVIHLTDPFDYDKGYHTDDDQPVVQTRADGGYQYFTADELEEGTRASARCRILSFNSKLSIDKNFHCGSDPRDSINIRAELPIDYELNYFITLNGGVKWHIVIPDPYVEKFEAGIDGKFAFTPQFKIGFKKEWKLDKDKWKKKLIEFSSYTFTFWVGPVPVVVKCDPSLYLKLDGKVSGAVDVGFKYEYENRFKAGVRYTDSNGWGVIKEFTEVKNDFTFIKPELQVHGEAGVGLYFGVDVMIYGVAGPEVAVGPRLGGEFNLTVSPFDEKKFDLNAAVKVSVNATAGAKLKILGYDLAEWSTTFLIAGPWTLFKYPSDGTEHKVNPSLASEWMSLFDSMKTSLYRKAYNANLQEAVNLLKAIKGIDDETAEKQIYATLMSNWDHCPEKNEGTYFSLLNELSRYREELAKDYDAYEYQQHADQGDIEWIKAYNWRKICEELKTNKIAGNRHSWFDTVSDEIRQWFLEEFNREPTLATTEDIEWLMSHIANYDYYKAATIKPSAEPADATEKDEKYSKEEYEKEQQEYQQKLEQAWQNIRQQIETLYPQEFEGRSPRGPKILNNIRRHFYEEYHHDPGTQQGDYELILRLFTARL